MKISNKCFFLLFFAILPLQGMAPPSVNIYLHNRKRISLLTKAKNSNDKPFSSNNHYVDDVKSNKGFEVQKKLQKTMNGVYDSTKACGVKVGNGFSAVVATLFCFLTF